MNEIKDNVVVSVVAPVYNPGAYLQPCIESVLSLTFDQWELILVDDGSSDGSAAICDEYSMKDERIKVFHKKNEGATSARRFGVEKAKGEWILFLDSDDCLPKTSIERLLSHDDHHTDIIVGTALYINSKDFYYTVGTEGNISYNEYLCRLLDHTTPIGPWAKLLKRHLFSNLQWLDYRVFNNEDLYMLICLAINSKQAVIIDNSDGYYICNDRPGTVSGRVMGYDGWKTLFTNIYQQLLKNNLMQGDTGVAYFNYVTRTLRRMCVERNVNYIDDDFIDLIKELQKTLAIPTTRNTRIVTNHFFRSLYMFINGFRKH